MTVIVFFSVFSALVATASASITIEMPKAQTEFEADPKFPPNERFDDIAILTSGNFSETVLDSPEAWVIIVHDGTMSRSWKTMAATSRGHFWMGMIDKTRNTNFLNAIKFNTEFSGRVYPHGNHAYKANHYTDIKSPMEARQTALKSMPNLVQKLYTTKIDEFLLDSYGSSPSRFPAIILTDDSKMGGLNRALALRFQKYFNFAYLDNPSTQDLTNLGIQSLFFEFPTIIILIFKRVEDENKNVDLSSSINAVAFDRHTMGDLDYVHIVQFLFSVNNQFRYSLPGDNQSNKIEVAKMLDIIETERKRFRVEEKEEEEVQTMDKEEFERTRDSRRHPDDKFMEDIEKRNRRFKQPDTEDDDDQMVFGDPEEMDEALEHLLAESSEFDNVTEDDLLIHDMAEKEHTDFFENHDEL